MSILSSDALQKATEESVYNGSELFENLSFDSDTIPTFKTIDETAKLIGIKPWHIRTWIRERRIDCYYKSGNKALINVGRLIYILNFEPKRLQ